ncbi:MAG: anti-sigma factor [Ancalomicrobiaceae bacterium]|nr:anti-sigma factor [Ancalomicrobiaceae bacterium]
MSERDDRPCAEWRDLMHGLVDGELDAEHARRVEAHLAEHAACADEFVRLKAARARLRAAYPPLAAPEPLRQRILAALAAEAPTRQPGIAERIAALVAWLTPASLPASAVLLALSIALFVWPQQVMAPNLEADLVAGHVRSLLADHLTDVATSDQHTVKPWFNGKVSFSPPVVDLAADGFPLVGGRLDYVGGEVTAALVFRHAGHVINLFVRPAHGERDGAANRDGYNLLIWHEDGLMLSAVSDLNAAELATFGAEFRKASGP